MVWLWVVLAVVAVALVALFVVADKCVKMVTLPVAHDEAYTRAEETERGFGDVIAAYDSEWERVPFELDRGDAVIKGELIPCPNPVPGPDGRVRVAVIAHGHTVNHISALKYAAVFRSEGFHCAIFDERYFGESTGTICTLGMKEVGDLAAVMARARQEWGSDAYMAIQGESMGAATVLLALAEPGANPDVVLADCPFCSTKRLVNEYLGAAMPAFLLGPVEWACEVVARHRYNYDFPRVNPIDAVAASDVPILFTHGEDDKLINCDHSRAMFKVVKNPASELRTFPGADHARSIVNNRSEYEALMKAFLKKVME